MPSTPWPSLPTAALWPPGAATVLGALGGVEEMGDAAAKAAAIHAYVTQVNAAVISRSLTPARAAILKKLAAAL
ncbi:hypothetical protein [Nonomuraea sp. NPDC048901]|uniref:hypothetical protein n=1 Tax=Nonomuraea sp. NPDC048901 TaxID=3155627 RepID=UPI00340B6E4A